MILVINDPHVSEKPPSVRTPEYFVQICKKLLECAKLEQKYCDFTVITGDIFHHKVARNVSHRTVRVLLGILKHFKKVYIVLGNHDILGAEQETSQRQPVGVVIESGLAEVMRPVLLPNDGIELYPMHYNEKFEQGLAPVLLPEQKGEKRIVFAHSMLSPNSGLRKDIKGFYDLVMYGHQHMPEGHVGKFVNYGAMARVRSDPWDRREVQVAIINKNLKVVPITLSSQKSWQEVFVTAAEGKDEEWGEEFLDAFVKALEIEAVDVNQDIDSIIGELSPEVRTRLQYYVGSV